MALSMKKWKNNHQIIILVFIVFFFSCASPKPDSVRVDHAIEKFTDKQIDCETPDDRTCFNDSPFGALVEKAFPAEGETAPHYVNILSHGDEALISRIHLIRSARQSIYFQTFIWGEDEASNFFFREMYLAARRGIKVKIIVDQLGAKAQIEELMLAALTHVNLEIKLYNPVYDRAKNTGGDMASAAVTQFGQLNQRMHNKLLIVDDVAAMTGGRNIENKYFDLDPVYSFKDRDILVIGHIVSQMKNSFIDYWGYEKSLPLTSLSDIGMKIEKVADRKTLEDKSYIYKESKVIEMYATKASDDTYIQKTFIDKAFKVEGRILFFVDNPGKIEGDDGSLNELIGKEVENTFYGAKESLIIQTPYLVFSKQALKGLKRLRKNNPDMKIIASSNSLAAADHHYVYAVAFKQKKRLVKKLKFKIYELKPVPTDVHDMILRYDALSEEKAKLDLTNVDNFMPKDSGTRVGIHSKSFVIDEKVAWIGSHNFDPRSDNLNTELGIMIWDDDVAQALKDEILRDTAPQNAWFVARRKQVPVISYFSSIIGSISRALPIFDIWPFRYTTSFDLKKGKEPVPTGHPDFYKYYKDLGAFPGINLSRRANEARMITAMGGFATPII